MSRSLLMSVGIAVGVMLVVIGASASMAIASWEEEVAAAGLLCDDAGSACFIQGNGIPPGQNAPCAFVPAGEPCSKATTNPHTGGACKCQRVVNDPHICYCKFTQ